MEEWLYLYYPWPLIGLERTLDHNKEEWNYCLICAEWATFLWNRLDNSSYLLVLNLTDLHFTCQEIVIYADLDTWVEKMLLNIPILGVINTLDKLECFSFHLHVWYYVKQSMQLWWFTLDPLFLQLGFKLDDSQGFGDDGGSGDDMRFQGCWFFVFYFGISEWVYLVILQIIFGTTAFLVVLEPTKATQTSRPSRLLFLLSGVLFPPYLQLILSLPSGLCSHVPVSGGPSHTTYSDNISIIIALLCFVLLHSVYHDLT